MAEGKENKIHSEDSVRNWFDRWYAEKKWNSMRNFKAYPVYLDYLNVKPGTFLLDIGCGPGWLLQTASRRGLKSCGVDLSREAVRLARITSPESLITVGSVTGIPFAAHSFHYITCIGVLEHFLNMESSIAEMKRVAKSDSVYCIMVPNSKTFYWKLAEKFSRNHRESNENARALEEWKKFFTTNGFRIYDIRRDEWIIRKTLSVVGLGSFSGLIRKVQQVIWSFVPLKYSRQFVFILEIEY
ncbi:MAG: methyltransferase domain-containing protein [Calditrichaeota bacterium]|nr:methyltransferase domain-containing protein [Calditrichota bacterium]